MSRGRWPLDLLVRQLGARTLSTSRRIPLVVVFALVAVALVGAFALSSRVVRPSLAGATVAEAPESQDGEVTSSAATVAVETTVAETSNAASLAAQLEVVAMGTALEVELDARIAAAGAAESERALGTAAVDEEPEPESTPAVPVEPSPAPTVEPTPEPTPAPTPEPTAEPTPEPTTDTTVEALPTGSGPTPEQWAQLRACESGGNYAINTGNGYYGAYQFSASTWDSLAARIAPELVGVLPHLASPGQQDAMALALFQSSGASPWPACGQALL